MLGKDIGKDDKAKEGKIKFHDINNFKEMEIGFPYCLWQKGIIINPHNFFYFRKIPKISSEVTTKPYDKDLASYEARLARLKTELNRATVSVPDKHIKTKKLKKNQRKNSNESAKLPKSARKRTHLKDETTPNPLAQDGFQDIISKKKNTLETVDMEVESITAKSKTADREQK